MLPLILAIALAAAACAPASGGVAPATTEALTPTTTSTRPPTTTTTTSVPATTTTSTPITATPLPAPERKRIVIHGTGDVSLMNGHVGGAFTEHGYDWAWSGLDGLFQRDDLTVINLECAPSLLGGPRDKKFTFRCDLESLPVMAESGIEVASLANNHAGDYGTRALLDGRANVAAAGVHPVGVGRDRSQATRPAFIEANGWTIAVLGFSLVSGGDGWFAGPNSPGVALADEATLVEAISQAEAAADLVVVTIHWGEEGDRTPRSVNRSRAEAMIAAGADVIFGHHSHRRNPLEVIDGKPVFWGLGNFVWPHLGAFSSEGYVGEVVVEPDGTITPRLLLSLVESHGHPVLQTPPDWTLRDTPNESA